MPAHRTIMRRIKEVLCLKWASNLTHRQVQGALGVGLETITQYLQLATEAGLDWAGAEPREQDKLERRILSPASPPAPAKRIELDCNVIHRELRRKGVTLQLLWEEYVESHPGGSTYRYTQFYQRYKDWAKTLKRSMRQQHRAGEKLFADFAGQTMPVLARDGGVAFQAHILVGLW
jgi:transposase